MILKICSKCNKPFPATTEFFHKQKNGKFGLFAECKVCFNKSRREHYRNNREKRTIVIKKWQENNKERITIHDAEYYRNNKNKIDAYNAKWRKANPDKVNAATAKRRALKLNQTPELTDSEDKQIKLIYKRSQELGSDWQVDHRIPISKGGQHHPDNLQIVTASYNLQKSDKLNFRLPTEKEVFNGESDRYM